MAGRENTGATLGSGEVDAEFWALVCLDEEWLDAEFEAIVGEAGEGRARPPTPLTVTVAAPCGSAERLRRASETWPLRTGSRPVRRWRRERGPPPPEECCRPSRTRPKDGDA